MFVLLPAQKIVAEQIATFREFSPRQKPGSFSIDKVISIADGDTLRILYRDGQLKIRLAEIDTPGRNQPWGTHAKKVFTT